jgi:hypothetical protein
MTEWALVEPQIESLQTKRLKMRTLERERETLVRQVGKKRERLDNIERELKRLSVETESEFRGLPGGKS